MICVTEYDLCLEFEQFPGTHRFHRALRANRHEYRGFDDSVPCGDASAAGLGGWIGGDEFKHGIWGGNHCPATIADVEQEFPPRKYLVLELPRLIFCKTLLAQRALTA